jgi:hypothetical protein
LPVVNARTSPIERGIITGIASASQHSRTIDFLISRPGYGMHEFSAIIAKDVQTESDNEVAPETLFPDNDRLPNNSIVYDDQTPA